jgi:hypothetical protein
MKADIPIGILTRDRVVYLAATIQSVMASVIPVKPVIYDDCSTNSYARKFLDTDEEFQVDYTWPKTKEWRQAGLQFLKDNPTIRGGELEVVKIGLAPMQVTNATSAAIADMFDMHPEAPAVILLQDDIVVARDWYQRITDYFQSSKNVGIIAGMHLDYASKSKIHYYTAQCYLISRQFFQDQRSWFDSVKKVPVSADGQLCQLATEAGFELHLMKPYICQHIGVISKCRPDKEFSTPQYTRLGKDFPFKPKKSNNVNIEYQQQVLQRMIKGRARLCEIERQRQYIKKLKLINQAEVNNESS